MSKCKDCSKARVLKLYSEEILCTELNLIVNKEQQACTIFDSKPSGQIINQ